MSPLQFLTSLLPSSLIRAVGRLQFHVPILAPLIDRMARLLTSRTGTIQRGVGKGLTFDATDASPGFLTGTSELSEQHVLADFLGPGKVFYDVGANVGFYAVIGARLVGPTGHVYAFEPVPDMAQRIRRNADLNDFENVTVIEAAVHETTGPVSFAASSSADMLGSNLLGSICRDERGEPAMEVSGVALDDWFPEQEPPDVILIDIEGAEIDALRGAMNLIRAHRPVLMVEVHWLGQDFLRFVEEHLRPLGYHATTYDGDALPSTPERYHALLQPAD